MRTKPRLAVALSARLQIAVDDQGRGTPHEVLEDIVLAIDRHPADASHHVWNHDRVALREVIQRLRGDDLRKRKYAERSGLLGMRDPAQKETRRALRMQPVVQRAQVGGPLVALRVDDDYMAQGAMKLAAESGDERRMPPARFELAAVTDGGAARKDLAVGGLQRVERDLQAHAQQSARQAKVIVGSGRKQMHVFGVTANEREEIGIERVSIGAIGKFDATNQVVLGGKHIVDGPHRNARIDGRVREHARGVSGAARVVGACVFGTRSA